MKRHQSGLEPFETRSLQLSLLVLVTAVRELTDSPCPARLCDPGIVLSHLCAKASASADVALCVSSVCVILWDSESQGRGLGEESLAKLRGSTQRTTISEPPLYPRPAPSLPPAPPRPFSPLPVCPLFPLLPLWYSPLASLFLLLLFLSWRTKNAVLAEAGE